MTKAAFRIVASLTLVVLTMVFFQNCGSGGGKSAGAGGGGGGIPIPAGLGTFVDDIVVGLTYTTSSGLSGVTDANGQFQFNIGDTVTFSALGVQIGVATPSIGSGGNTVVTPVDLVPGATDVNNQQVIDIAVFLNTLNAVSVSIGTNSNGASNFVIPTNVPGLQAALDTNSTATSITVQLSVALATTSSSVGLASTSTAQAALQNGLSNSSFMGTAWNAVCDTCHGAYIYLKPDGSISGVTYGDGNYLVGSWSSNGGTASFSVNSVGDQGGATGTLTGSSGTGTVVDGNGTHNLTITEITGASSASSWTGYWDITYTPYPGAADNWNQAGCGNMIVGPGTYYAVTNDGQGFSGAIDGSGNGSGSFQNGSNGTTGLNFNISTGTGTVTGNGAVQGTLSFSRSGSCAISNNNNNNGGGSGPSPNPSPGPSPGPGPGPSPNPGPSPSPMPSPSPTPLNNSSTVNIPLIWNWTNGTMSVDSTGATLTVFDQSHLQVAFTNQSEVSGANHDGTPFSTNSNIAVSFPVGTAATYSVIVSNCMVIGGTGNVGADNSTVYPAITINCP